MVTVTGRPTAGTASMQQGAHANFMVPVVVDPVYILERDKRAAVLMMTPDEVRFLVDSYYEMQENRKRAGNQTLALSKLGEPNLVLEWLTSQNSRMEKSILGALKVYADSKVLGRWAQSIVGVGPIITAGLMTHINISKAPTVGHIWRFAGLDPTDKWEDGEKRPWDAGLKTLCWKIGESFVKVSNNPGDIYGKIYQERKAREIGRNDAGELADQAAEALKRKKYSKTTEAYKAYILGRLPPAHLHARAKRYAVKLFLAHYHHVAYELEYGTPPPKPYILTQPGHVHFIAPPNWPIA